METFNIYTYIYPGGRRHRARVLAARMPVAFIDTRQAAGIRDFKDTVCPFFESDTLFLEGFLVLFFSSCSAILCTVRAEVAGQSFVMRRDAGGADAGDPKLLTVHFHGAEGAAVVVDAEGRLPKITSHDLNSPQFASIHLHSTQFPSSHPSQVGLRI